MIEQMECLDCGWVWKYDEMDNDFECPECGSEEVAEQYNLICLDCSHEFCAGSEDYCPECGGEAEEV